MSSTAPEESQLSGVATDGSWPKPGISEGQRYGSSVVALTYAGSALASYCALNFEHWRPSPRFATREDEVPVVRA